VNSTSDLPDQVISAIRSGRKIDAIKLLRESRGIGLKEAKHAVDAYMRVNPSPQQPKSSAHGTTLLGLLLLVATIAWTFFYHECAAGGAMGGWYKDCSCRGIERIDFDNTAADGPLRTVCYGLVAERTCYRSRGGPEISCDAVDQ
jgi:hypothetical protein